MNKLAMSAAVALAASSLWAVQGTIYTDKDQKSGDIRWQPASKSYAVTVKRQGGAPITVQYALEDVTRLSIPEPAGYEKAVAMVQRGQGGAAVGTLSKIVQEYKMLTWDKLAGRYLVEAYLAANNAQKAYETAQGIIRDDRDAAWSGDLAPAYWQALLKIGKKSQLENCLKRAASAGDRAASAAALVMRGDIILADGGDNLAAYRSALTDAYLRVVLMYGDSACREARRDAMQRAAICFDKLGMAARADAMRTQAKSI